ncbi:uncharacterized protein METZ01_LOCUS493488, partial [marine metagenome]
MPEIKLNGTQSADVMLSKSILHV